MTTPNHRALLTLAAASLVLISAPAWAFRTIEDNPEVPDGAQVHWPDGVFVYRVHDDPEDSIDVGTLAQASRQALETWTLASCPRIVSADMGTTEEPAASGDGLNTIELVETDWDRLGYPREATGATDVLFEERSDGTWAIVEADIYINAEYHSFTTSVPAADERSLVGVLAHELGHALGLLHPCEVDGAGRAPVCDEEDLPDALMSPYYEADQTLPESDDVDGLCYLYSDCESEEDCAEGLVCEAGECVPGDEGGGGECDAGAGRQSSENCVIKRPIGDECTESNECEGEQCLEGVYTDPVCTRLCGEGQPDCPRAWTCVTVEDRKVCLPPDRDSGCECALNRPGQVDGPRQAPGLPFLTGLSLVSLLVLRRARRRASKTNEPPLENWP